MVWAAIDPVLEHKNVGIIEKHLRIFLPLCVCVCVCVCVCINNMCVSYTVL